MHTLRFTFLAIFIFSMNFSFAAHTASYVESSNGLQTPAMDGGRTELELADINNDGHLDILSIGDHGSPYINTQQHGVTVWFGDGDGNWSVSQYGDFGYGGIAVGDVNNDGLLDVAYGMHHNYSASDLGDQLIEAALGDGAGTFWTPWDDGLATNGESWGMFGTDLADIDNDGDLDIGSDSFGASAGVHIYRNNGDGTWTQTFGFTGGNSTMDFVFGDVNNDGFADFATAQEYGTIYIGDGLGGFTFADGNLPPAGSIGRYGPDLGNIDNDGMDELSFCNSSGGVEVWKWGQNHNWTKVSNGLPASGSFDISQIADMDMDGFADVAAFGGGIVTVWKGSGGSQWSQMTSFNLPQSGDCKAFRIEGDADQNGYPDIALVSNEGTWISSQNHLRFFKEDSPADSLTISAVYPGPNRLWQTSSVQTIRWVSEVPSGDSSVVRLEISVNDTLGPWHLIADSLRNNGHYQWIVPVNMGSTEPARIRYTVYAGTDSVSAFTPSGFHIEPAVYIEEPQLNFADEFTLLGNYPNPFNPLTTIEFRLEKPQHVDIEIFNALGQHVATLLNKKQSAGQHSVEWNAAGFPSGIYYYRISAGGISKLKKVVLLH